MKYRECQDWVKEVIETYKCLMDEILKLKSVEEIKRKIGEFRGELKEEDLTCSGIESEDRNLKNTEKTEGAEMPEIKFLHEVIIDYLKNRCRRTLQPGS